MSRRRAPVQLKLFAGRRRASGLPWWARTLGLADWPADLATIKSAWKRSAMKCHPDTGGDTDSFLRVKAAYDAAMHRRAL